MSRASRQRVASSPNLEDEPPAAAKPERETGGTRAAPILTASRHQQAGRAEDATESGGSGEEAEGSEEEAEGRRGGRQGTMSQRAEHDEDEDEGEDEESDEGDDGDDMLQRMVAGARRKQVQSAHARG